jgi:hypothetical protein
MKYIILFFSLVFFSAGIMAQSQNSQADQGQRLARKQAQAMKDSLNLTGQQMNQLYDINLSLHNQKKQVLQSGMSRDSIGRRLQQIEGTRDSLYRAAIPVDKFEQYKNKKRRLIHNNN